MIQKFTVSKFLVRFPTDEACLEEFKKLRFPNGIFCAVCKKITKHYKLKRRTAYACKFCRVQVFPLAGTILQKTTTPLGIWFYAMFVMTHTRAKISVRDLQQEIGVTYKTAWRMHKNIKILMSQNNADLLKDVQESVQRWTLFNKFEITVTQKQEA